MSTPDEITKLVDIIRNIEGDGDLLRKLRAMDAATGSHALPCGHSVADLIGGTEQGPDGKERPCVTKCGACLALRQNEIRATREAKAELTPEVVLRAMLTAYQEFAITAAVEFYSATEDTEAVYLRRSCQADLTLNNIQDTLARILTGASVALPVELDRDYRARLAGERPLDAPPLEAP